jgi:hypothetical protein
VYDERLLGVDPKTQMKNGMIEGFFKKYKKIKK